jgi:hypothetical protein
MACAHEEIAQQHPALAVRGMRLVSSCADTAPSRPMAMPT